MTGTRTSVQAGTHSIPVLFRKDAVIVGASFAGIAAALELAKAGKQVVVIESRTYPGREITATHRYWRSKPQSSAACSDLWEGCLQACGAAVEGGEVSFHPDKLKRYLEDTLFEAGVELLYASLPIEVIRTDGAVKGLVIANKSGMQAVEGQWIVDATDTNVTGAIQGITSGEVPEPDSYYARVLELDGVKTWKAEEGSSALEVPESLQLAGNKVYLHRGIRGNGHVLVEFFMKLPSGNTLWESGAREREARHRSHALAAHLIGTVKELQGAYLAGASHELCGPYPMWKEDTGFVDVAQWNTSAGCTLPGDWQPQRNRGIWMATPLWRPLSEPWWWDPEIASAAGSRLGLMILIDALAAAAPEEPDGHIAAPEDEPSRYDSGHSFDEKASSLKGLSLQTLHSPQQGGCMERRTVDPFEIPLLAKVDVLVAGGGTSGATAGITAAQEGLKTVVLEFNAGLGGTGTLGGVDSYWFGRKVGFAAKITSLVHEVQEQLQYSGHKWNIEAKMYALLREAERAEADIWFNTILFGVLMDGSHVKGAVAATRWGPAAIRSEALLDATGDGDAAAFAGAQFVYGSERDHTVMWYSLAQFERPGRTQNNFTSMVNVSNVLDYTRAIVAGRRRGNEPYEHGVYVATRESRHILGDCVMKLTDQMLGRRWPDVINVHFSNHDIKGVSGADWVNVGCIPPNLEIEIPYRMLLPAGLDGILIVGKAISATHDALPAIRMQADLENLGGAAALAAAHSIREGVTPRKVDIPTLQRRLIEIGLLSPGTDTRRLEPIVYSDEELRELVDSLDSLQDDRPLYYYGNMRMNEVFTDKIPFVEICSVGPRVIPFLTEALRHASGRRRILIAQALTMLECKEGVPVLIEEIERLLRDADGGLPLRKDDFMYVQLPPDHGAMPEAAYLLYSLGLAADERSLEVWRKVVSRLHPEESEYKKMLSGAFYYVHSVCMGMERLADPRAFPLLEKLHESAALRGLVALKGAEPDYFLERRAMLELAIGRAMARCGSRSGYEILISYLKDVRSLLAESAHKELLLLNEGGEDFGFQTELWQRWLNSRGSRLQPIPLKLRLDMEPDSGKLLRRIR